MKTPAAFLFVGGELRIDTRGDRDSHRRLAQTVGRLAQVRNLAVLVGAGASLHLGSPNIRGLDEKEIHELLEQHNQGLDSTEESALRSLVVERVDFEDLLATLGMSIAYGNRMSKQSIAVGEESYDLQVLISLRRHLNRALVRACDLPRPHEELPPAASESDPLVAHRDLFIRLLRTRRERLPRICIFTTNYDLLIEKTLDQIGVPYFDGFMGTITRTFHPESYQFELYSAHASEDGGRMLPVSTSFSLLKLHGSINWRSVRSPLGGGTDVVVQSAELGDDLALIYPTPQKEAEVLGYPYSELFRRLALAIGQPETALLVIGYGFADDHVNRLLLQALAANPTLHLFVVSPTSPLVSPDEFMDATVDDSSDENASAPLTADTPVGYLAREPDARISVLAGPAARFVDFARHVMPNPGYGLTPEESTRPSADLLVALGIEKDEGE